MPQNAAEVTAAELEAVKRYMRVDWDEDDALISALYSAAKVYLCAGCGPYPDDGSPLYDLALWGLTLHYYDHRDDVGNEAIIPRGLRPIISQLQITTKTVVEE